MPPLDRVLRLAAAGAAPSLCVLASDDPDSPIRQRNFRAEALVLAYLSLGSNLGDRRGQLKTAVAAIADVRRVERVVGLSDVYETAPVGGPTQDDFLNIVLAVETDLTARELLGVCHDLEEAAGRVRGDRWGPRTLDVDILVTDTDPIDDPDLQIPHPRMNQRRFVMEPLGDLAPALLPPDWEDQAEGEVTRLGPL